MGESLEKLARDLESKRLELLHAKDTIKSLTDENQQLKAKLGNAPAKSAEPERKPDQKSAQSPFGQSTSTAKEIVELQQKVKELTQKQVQDKQLIAELGLQRERNRKQLQDTISALIDTKDDLKKARSDLEKLRAGHAEEQHHAAAPEQKPPKPREPENETEFQKIQNELEARTSELARARNIIATLSFQKERTRRVLQETNSALIDANTDVAKFRENLQNDSKVAEIEKLKSNLAELSFQRETMRRETQEAKSALIDALDQLKLLLPQVESHGKRESKLQGTIAALSFQKEGTRRLLQESTSALIDCRDEIKQLRAKLESSEAQLKQKAAENQRLAAQLSKDSAQIAFQKESVRRKLQETNSALIDAKDEMKNYSANLEKLQRTIAVKDGEIERLEQQISVLSVQKEQTRRVSQETNSALIDAVGEDAQKQKQIEGLKGALAKSEAEKKSLEARLTQQIANIAFQKERTRRTSQETNSALIDALDTIKKLEADRKASPEVQKDSEVRKLNEDLAKMQSEVNRLTRLTKEVDKALSVAQEEKEGAVREAGGLREQMKRAMLEFEELRRQSQEKEQQFSSAINAKEAEKTSLETSIKAKTTAVIVTSGVAVASAAFGVFALLKKKK